MQRRVGVASRGAQSLEVRHDAGRLVDRKLLRDGEMQRQVQERIDVALLGTVVAVDMLLGRLDDRVILRMHRNQLRRGLLERRQRLAGAVLAPRVDQEAARLVARRREHGTRAC